VSLPRATSIRQRLLLISAAITVLALVVAVGLFAVNDVRMLRSQMVRDLEVLSVVVGDNCLSALVFDAPETAEKNLASLRQEYQIRYAVLYDAAGRAFAQYRRGDEGIIRDPIGTGQGVFLDTSWLGTGSVDVVRELILDGRAVGKIFIHAGMDELSAQLRRYAGVSGLVFLVTLVTSLLLALRLQRQVSEPILRLAAKTREISEQGNYAVRVIEPESDDEIAALYRGFNIMLDQIERHERDLREIRSHLEQLVEERTRRLDGVVREQRLILEALPLGVVHLVERRVVRVNPRAVELFGWGEDEMLGLTTECFYPDRAAFEEVGRVAYAQMSSGRTYRTDRTLRRKDGSRFWGRLIGQYIDPNDPDVGSIWIVDDIDRDKALEDSLRQARESAEAANRAKDAFLANMSHELRTPLNAILGFAQVLEDDWLEDLQRQHLQGIHRGAERLLGLINEVLDLAKIEAGRFELMPVEWDSHELLSELAGIFRPRADEKGILLRVEPSASLPAILTCDAQRVNQILVNLLDNAIKYTDQGSVTLSAGFADGRLDLAVADTGIGIVSDRLQVVFEPFEQGGGAERRGQGAGLGLAITKKLVARMGGTIAVESEPGRGSTFRVRIPANAVFDRGGKRHTAASEARVIGYRRSAGEGALRVLVVDDEPENRAVLRLMLAPLGFDVSEAETGIDCIERVKGSMPDLVLLDLRMPGMDGLAATRSLRALPGTQQLRIVAVTAAAFDRDRARALEAGCDRHLAKPVLRESLLQIIGDLLPLEWVEGEQPLETPMPRYLESLSPEQAVRFANLVRIGDIAGVKVFAEALAKEGRYPALTREIKVSADAFDVRALRRLVERVGASCHFSGEP
jgi:PAS domain S-box-containing protein